MSDDGERKRTFFEGKYFGITHGRAYNCKQNRHKFDEVYGTGGHYLSCDNCGLMVHIQSIETTWVGVR